MATIINNTNARRALPYHVGDELCVCELAPGGNIVADDEAMAVRVAHVSLFEAGDFACSIERTDAAPGALPLAADDEDDLGDFDVATEEAE